MIAGYMPVFIKAGKNPGINHLSFGLLSVLHQNNQTMAILLDNGALVGRLKNLSFYQQQSTGKVIVRFKRGVSKKRIKNDPAYARTRKLNRDFGACSRAVGNIRYPLYRLLHLADYNFSPVLQVVCKNIQERDDQHKLGEKNIYFSRFAYLLKGFQLNQKNTFDSLVRHPLECTINKETGTAIISIPELQAGVNLFLPWKSPYYRLRITFGVVPDELFSVTPQPMEDAALAEDFMGEWQPVRQRSAAQQVEMKLDECLYKPEEGYAVVVSVGIEMGTPLTDKLIEIVPRHGAAKILAAG